MASHLISEGMVDEGLTIVKATRSRHEGHVRNPWNEYECGAYYARAMSSYALLGALSGFSYSAAKKTLRFVPRLDVNPFTTFISTATGWGTLTLAGKTLTINLVEGELSVETLETEYKGETKKLKPGITARAGKPTKLDLS